MDTKLRLPNITLDVSPRLSCSKSLISVTRVGSSTPIMLSLFSFICSRVNARLSTSPTRCPQPGRLRCLKAAAAAFYKSESLPKKHNNGTIRPYQSRYKNNIFYHLKKTFPKTNEGTKLSSVIKACEIFSAAFVAKMI